MTERDVDNFITEYREKRLELLKTAQKAGEAIAVIAVERKQTMTEKDLDMTIKEYREKRLELLQLAQQASETIAVIAVESKANDGEISEEHSRRHQKLEYIKNKIIRNL